MRFIMEILRSAMLRTALQLNLAHWCCLLSGVTRLRSERSKCDNCCAIT